MERIPVFSTTDIPELIIDELKEYYAGTDHRYILNNSYTRYPYLFDFSNQDLSDLDRWFIGRGVSILDGYIIIKWDW